MLHHSGGASALERSWHCWILSERSCVFVSGNTSYLCALEARFAPKIIIFALKLKYLFGQPYGISRCNVLTDRILLSIQCQSKSRDRHARQLLRRFASILFSRHQYEITAIIQPRLWARGDIRENQALDIFNENENSDVEITDQSDE